ncbi:hypothetical protein WMY93_013000 [Mugilogobius chulae]|uniref:Interleukin 17a/f1 n=1 Tax=Mugilogobius chulae TaxID=88201 RepID=A0AAW0PAD0_9GOBI
MRCVGSKTVRHKKDCYIITGNTNRLNKSVILNTTTTPEQPNLNLQLNPRSPPDSVRDPTPTWLLPAARDWVHLKTLQSLKFLDLLKTSHAYFLVLLMLLSGTEGARIRRGNEHSKHRTIDMVPLQLDTTALTPKVAMRALHNSSISPWTYNDSHDASLYPSFLSEARCLLRGCLNSSGQEDMSLESKPIMHEILQLRRVRSSHDSSYHYKLEPRLLAVGCTCVQPIVHHQQ